MIAIAGAKGGCGKTTATLGLARALAAAGEPTIAVDADRQLPDLHVNAGVDREPTVAALDGNTDVTSVARQVPGAPGVGVIPAQKSSETVDLEATLERLDYDSVEVVVDCPSGAGPDVVEPISAADEVVVVTTATERSVSSARTTIDVARRLDVPVAGVVVNRADAASEELLEELDVDVLGAVPECEEPLSADPVATAFEEIAGRLAGESDRAPAEPGAPRRPDRLPTGIDGLDTLLGGGLPPGSVVALEAEPASQSELLLYSMTATRGTLYLSTERSEESVRDALGASPVEVGSPTVRSLDVEAPLGQARELVENLPEGANLVLDSADPLERMDRGSYVSFLNALKERTLEVEGLAVLLCLDGDHASEHRSLTEHFADAVVGFETVADDDGVTHHAEVRKFRAESRPKRRGTIRLTEEIPVEAPHP